MRGRRGGSRSRGRNRSLVVVRATHELYVDEGYVDRPIDERDVEGLPGGVGTRDGAHHVRSAG
jgi:hypothetical protein